MSREHARTVSLSQFAQIHIDSYIFREETINLGKMLDELVLKNRFEGNPDGGFLFRGLYYSNWPVSMQKQLEKRPVSTNLESLCADYVAAQARLDNDRRRVSMGLSILLPMRGSYQDMRDALPNFCKDMCYETQQLERTRPEAYTLASKPMKLSQWNTTKLILETYMANKLLS